MVYVVMNEGEPRAAFYSRSDAEEFIEAQEEADYEASREELDLGNDDISDSHNQEAAYLASYGNGEYTCVSISDEQLAKDIVVIDDCEYFPDDIRNLLKISDDSEDLF